MAQESNLYSSRRITDNLVRSVELTELCFRLRQAVLKQGCSDDEAWRGVMSEVRQAKERAWRQSPS